LQAGSFVCDVGCGNGRYMGCGILPGKQENTSSLLKESTTATPTTGILQSGVFIHGVDTSKNLLNIARENDFEVGTGNLLSLPFRDKLFDVVICIAVIHHLSTHQHRLSAIQEIARILRSEGLTLIYVWAFEQEKRKFRQQDVFVPWKLRNKNQPGTLANANELEEGGGGVLGKEQEKLVETNSSDHVTHQQQEGTVMAQGGGVLQRYYHVFKKGELEELVTATDLFDIIESQYDNDNWVVLAKKKET